MDGVVAIGGCDKNMPGAMMAIARMNIPAIFVYGGTIKPGHYNGKDLTIVSAFEAVDSWDAETLKFKYSDETTFNPWKDVELWLGYYRNGVDERRRMLIGELTTMSPNFPESGAPTLTARALAWLTPSTFFFAVVSGTRMRSS